MCPYHDPTTRPVVKDRRFGTGSLRFIGVVERIAVVISALLLQLFVLFEELFLFSSACLDLGPEPFDSELSIN